MYESGSKNRVPCIHEPYCHVTASEERARVPLPQCNSNEVEENLCYPATSTWCMGNMEVFEMVNLPDLIKPNHQHLDSDLMSAVEAIPLQTVPSFESSSGYNFPLLHEPQLDFPLFPRVQTPCSGAP
ncbi:hypothetical protein RJT34_01356 [Clitoria ternatea]|uniref:Uncharacterized protein n=1 Tax=Clitoria ternatea TaxID=43366 RepID=A0AAN9KK83_CLITE